MYTRVCFAPQGPQPSSFPEQGQMEVVSSRTCFVKSPIATGPSQKMDFPSHSDFKSMWLIFIHTMYISHKHIPLLYLV